MQACGAGPGSIPTVFTVEWEIGSTTSQLALYFSSLENTMPIHIKAPTVIAAAGTPPKRIEEFIGQVSSGEAAISIARTGFSPVPRASCTLRAAARALPLIV